MMIIHSEIPPEEFWYSRASDLAEWTLARLVNRTDACGGYYAAGQVTRKITVDHKLLVQHYRATQVDHIIGLHSASAVNLTKWGGLDIDQHGPDDPKKAMQ